MECNNASPRANHTVKRLGSTSPAYANCSDALDNAGPVSMDTGIIVAIDPYQPTVTPASLHALGGHDFDLLLQPENYGSFSDGLLDLALSVNDPMQSPGCYVPDGVFYSGGQKHYVDPDMVNPPGSANPNIYE